MAARYHHRGAVCGTWPWATSTHKMREQRASSASGSPAIDVCGLHHPTEAERCVTAHLWSQSRPTTIRPLAWPCIDMRKKREPKTNVFGDNEQGLLFRIKSGWHKQPETMDPISVQHMQTRGEGTRGTLARQATMHAAKSHALNATEAKHPHKNG